MPKATESSRKTARLRLSGRYLAALRVHLGQNGAARSGPAHRLGSAAVTRGLAILDLAIIHEWALMSLAPSFDFSNSHGRTIRQAGEFFAAALAPLEAVQRASEEAAELLRQHNLTLRANTLALAKGNRRLQLEIERREAGEIVIRRGKERYQKLFLESQAMQKKLRQLTRQIISAQEDERKEISRELHDEVVQTLVGINVELAALGKGARIGLKALKQKISRTQRLVENSVNAVHRFARELRPAVLDDLGLIPALHAYNKNLAARKKLKIRMTAFGGVEALGAAKRTVLFRVAQEALTNVARHAHATQVRMSISEKAGSIHMEISDNGRSFQVAKVLSARTPKRLGLVGMKERVEMVGGTLTIASEPGQGTTVSAVVPFRGEPKTL